MDEYKKIIYVIIFFVILDIVTTAIGLGYLDSYINLGGNRAALSQESSPIFQNFPGLLTLLICKIVGVIIIILVGRWISTRYKTDKKGYDSTLFLMVILGIIAFTQNLAFIYPLQNFPIILIMAISIIIVYNGWIGDEIKC